MPAFFARTREQGTATGAGWRSILSAMLVAAAWLAGPAVQAQVAPDQQAAMILRASEQSVPEPADRADVQWAYDNVVAAAAAVDPLERAAQCEGRAPDWAHPLTSIGHLRLSKALGL